MPTEDLYKDAYYREKEIQRIKDNYFTNKIGLSDVIKEVKRINNISIEKAFNLVINIWKWRDRRWKLQEQLRGK